MEPEDEEPEDPRIAAAEYERDFPEVETGPDRRHQNYPEGWSEP
jgi:hypothetical protein